MSACRRASAGIRERLRGVGLAALLFGLSGASPAFGQVPIFAPADEAAAPAEPVPVPPPLAPPAAPPPPTPIPGEAPDREASREQPHPMAVRYTLEAIQVRGNTRTE